MYIHLTHIIYIHLCVLDDLTCFSSLEDLTNLQHGDNVDLTCRVEVWGGLLPNLVWRRGTTELQGVVEHEDGEE